LRTYWVQDASRTDEVLTLETSFADMAQVLEKMLYE